MSAREIAVLVADVAACTTPATLVNPLRDRADELDLPDAPAIRTANLLAYLAARPRPRAILAGEAMGWRGGRFSGIAFTSERQLAQWGAPFAASSAKSADARGPHSGATPNATPGETRSPRSGTAPTAAAGRTKGTATGSAFHGWTESSATIIHGMLDELDAEREVVLWNTVPFHPHPPGRPLANRAPKRGEIVLGRPYLERLIALLAPADVIAVGRVAEGALGDLATGRVRHPAQGGATQCREGLRALLG